MSLIVVRKKKEDKPTFAKEACSRAECLRIFILGKLFPIGRWILFWSFWCQTCLFTQVELIIGCDLVDWCGPVPEIKGSKSKVKEEGIEGGNYSLALSLLQENASNNVIAAKPTRKDALTEKV